MNNRPRPDMQQIANITGVSRATVSRALADSPLVNTSTRERIKSVAAELGYVLNHSARNFRLGRTGVVSVVLTLEASSQQHISDPFFLEMIGVIADVLGESGYNTLLAHERFRDAGEFMRSSIYQQSEGLIFLGQGHLHAQLNALAAGSLPIMVWGAPLPDRQYPVVGADNVEGGYQVTRHLVQCDRQRIAFLGDKQLPEMAGRYAGYRRALDESGLNWDPQLESAVPFDASEALHAIRRFLAACPDVDGIMCCSDLIAMSAVSALNEIGLSVPDDVSVTGFDNILFAERATPPLTTYSQQIAEGGRALVEGLLRQFNGEPCADHIARGELIIRTSSSAFAATVPGDQQG